MKVLIAGMGLIGGSFALALRDHELAEEILGVENSEEHAAECYLRTTGWEGEVQFDLAAAEAFPDGTVRVELIENALEYNW